MKNRKGEDMTSIESAFHEAGAELVAATREGRYFGEERTYYNLMQDVFYIALYQSVQKALDFWDKYLPNCGRMG